MTFREKGLEGHRAGVPGEDRGRSWDGSRGASILVMGRDQMTLPKPCCTASSTPRRSRASHHLRGVLRPAEAERKLRGRSQPGPRRTGSWSTSPAGANCRATSRTATSPCRCSRPPPRSRPTSQGVFIAGSTSCSRKPCRPLRSPICRSRRSRVSLGRRAMVLVIFCVAALGLAGLSLLMMPKPTEAPTPATGLGQEVHQKGRMRSTRPQRPLRLTRSEAGQRRLSLLTRTGRTRAGTGGAVAVRAEARAGGWGTGGARRRRSVAAPAMDAGCVGLRRDGPSAGARHKTATGRSSRAPGSGGQAWSRDEQITSARRPRHCGDGSRPRILSASTPGQPSTGPRVPAVPSSRSCWSAARRSSMSRWSNARVRSTMPRSCPTNSWTRSNGSRRRSSGSSSIGIPDTSAPGRGAAGPGRWPRPPRGTAVPGSCCGPTVPV